MHYYQPGDSKLWQCRADAQIGDYFCHNILPCNLETTSLALQNFALLGFASDLGVERNQGRLGAKLAPAAIRQFLSRLAIPYLNQCYDCGDIIVDNQAPSLLAAQTMLSEKVAQLVRARITPLVLGGGHETAYGHYLGLMNGVNEDVAILNFDAHFDLRPLSGNDDEGSSGTPFRQIYNQCQARGRNFNYYCIGIQPRSNSRALYEFAEESKSQFIQASSVNDTPLRVLDLVNQIILRHKHIYVTICLDVFHYSFAPGVSAPQALGINPQIVIQALHLLAKSGRVLGLDVVELNPNYDIDNHTARLAANLISEFYYPLD